MNTGAHEDRMPEDSAGSKVIKTFFVLSEQCPGFLSLVDHMTVSYTLRWVIEILMHTSRVDEGVNKMSFLFVLIIYSVLYSQNGFRPHADFLSPSLMSFIMSCFRLYCRLCEYRLCSDVVFLMLLKAIYCIKKTSHGQCWMYLKHKIW